MMRVVLVAILTALGLVSSVASQTVSLTDFPNWVGKFTVKDSVKIGYGYGYHLGECIESWQDSVGPLGLSRLVGMAGSGIPDRQYRYLYTEKMGQHGLSPAAGNRPALLAHIFLEFMAGSCLTVWQRLPEDSLRLLCTMELPYYEWNGEDSVWIDGIYLFPDTSLLIHVRCEGIPDGFGTWYGLDMFVRYGRPDTLDVLYRSGWASRDRVRYTFDMSMFGLPAYRVVRTTEYLSRASEDRASPTDGMAIDSASSEVIDLWTLAVQKFGIDTTNLSTRNR